MSLPLKPCPFCGGEAFHGNVTYCENTVREQEWDQDTFHKVNCVSCGANNLSAVGYATPEGAAEAWNRRAEGRPSPEVEDGFASDEFLEWYKWAREWSGSAFLADEPVSAEDASDLKRRLYSDLCRLGNHFSAWADLAAISALSPELYACEVSDVLDAIDEHRDDPAEEWTISLSADHWLCLAAHLRRSTPSPERAALLQDANVVHINMLRGGIAKLTPAQIGHLYRGDEAAEVIREVARQNSGAEGAPAGEVKEVLEMTGLRTIAEVIDMANVGQSLMERIADLVKQEGPFKDWRPADDPAEIVFDLVNHYEDAALSTPAPEPDLFAGNAKKPEPGYEAEPVAITDEVVRYIARYGGMCRGCADEDGVCPASGLPCEPDDCDRAIRHVLKALSYGQRHGYIKAASPVPVAISREEIVALITDRVGAFFPEDRDMWLTDVGNAADAILQRLSNQQKEG